MTHTNILLLPYLNNYKCKRLNKLSNANERTEQTDGGATAATATCFLHTNKKRYSAISIIFIGVGLLSDAKRLLNVKFT